MKNELKNITKSSFKIPDGYFDTIEDNVFAQVKLESKITGANDGGFKIPEDYFNGIENKVMDAIDSSKKPKVIVLNRSKFYYVAGIAASIVLLISIFIPKQDVSFESLDHDLVESYVEEHYFDTEDLATLLSDSELEAYTNTDYILSDDHLEDYFLENSSLEDLLIE